MNVNISGKNVSPGELLYEGKAKKIFSVKERDDLIWQVFKDSFTAFNGEKKATMEGKGEINCTIATMIYRHLEKSGIPTHFQGYQPPTIMVTQKLRRVFTQRKARG